MAVTDETLVDLDECGIPQNLYRESGWAPRGEEVFGKRTGKREKKLNLIAVYTLHGQDFGFVEQLKIQSHQRLELVSEFDLNRCQTLVNSLLKRFEILIIGIIQDLFLDQAPEPLNQIEIG